MVLNKRSADLFVHWVKQREMCRVNRRTGVKAPWCDDPIINSHHFCNVHREDDRVTKELNQVVVRLGPENWELPTIWTAARMFNHAPSLETYWKGGVQAVKQRRFHDRKIFNTAYVVSTCGKSMDKVDYVDQVVNTVEATPISPRSCAEAFRDLRSVDGLGSFMAGQIVADLKYTSHLAEAPDWTSFAVMGPGSKKGMDLLVGGGTTERNFMERLTFVRSVLDMELPKMHNQDFQNCLCEFSKYMRYLDNTPGRRRPYVQC